MNANHERVVSQARRGLSPVALRLSFVLAAAAAAFFFGMASAHADDTDGDSPAQASEAQDPGRDDAAQDRAGHESLLPGPEGPSTPVPEQSQEPSPAASSEPAEAPAKQATPEQSEASEAAAPAVIDAPDATTSKPARVKPESPAVQGNSHDLGASETLTKVAQGIERGVTPAITSVDGTTRQLARDLEPVIGKDSQLTQAVRDLETVTRNVETLVEQTTRPVQVGVEVLSNKLGLSPAVAPVARAEGAAPVDRKRAVVTTVRAQAIARTHQTREVVVRDSATAHDTQAVSPQQKAGSETRSDEGASHDNDQLAGATALCANGSAGGSSAGSSVAMTAIVPAAISFIGGSDCINTGADSDVPRSAGRQPGVAPD
ncbi:hypothetical protein ASD30_05180 [Nocardioides sp. Root140]|nr:hypothetical protein ASD30_05180 [Nocardioides sp. Root140]